MLFDEHVVAVVPPGHQPQVMDGRKHRGTRSHDAPDMASEHLQPGRVARLRTLPRSEADMLPSPQQRQQSGVDAVNVAVVRNHDEGPAASGK